MARHKDLTGADLHEPKGAASASANRVYVSDGAGSGTWSQINKDMLTQNANPFASALLQVSDEVDSETSIQSFSASAWNVRRLQTVKYNEIGATVSNNSITLNAGTYFIFASVQCPHNAGSQTLRFYNQTTDTPLVRGNRFSTGSTGAVFDTCQVFMGKFEVTTTSVCTLQNWTELAHTSSQSSGPGNHRYAEVCIWKLS